MKRLILWAVLLFPLATLIFWMWLGLSKRHPLPQALPGDTEMPAVSTNQGPAK